MNNLSLLITAAAAVSSATFASVAYANGAFPDSQAVLLSLQQPRRITLASNFGLVVSEDDGQSWQYSCETSATSNGRLYALGAAPDERIVVVSDRGAATSADQGCTWSVGAGLLQGALVSDVFADPTDPRRVLAVGKLPGAALPLAARLFASSDGGVTYDQILEGVSVSDTGGISGVEIARSDPRVIYVTSFEAGADGVIHPRLARSADGGATFDSVDLEPLLGTGTPSLAAVDPGDARHIFLRFLGTNAQMRSVDQLAVSTDGGGSFTVAVSLTGGTLTSFLARQNGTVLVSGRLGASVVSYRSQDGGATFPSWRSGLHPRGFAERGSTLFAATDSATDGFALASSDDDGDTWTPRMRFSDIQGVRACVRQECGGDCQAQVARDVFAATVCGPEDPSRMPGAVDGGTGRGSSGSGCSLAPPRPLGPTTWSGWGVPMAIGLLMACGGGLLVCRGRSPRSDSNR